MKLTTFSVCGTKCSELFLSSIESVELVRGCFGKPAFRVTYTEDGYQKARTACGSCKCCVKKTFDVGWYILAHPMLFFLGLNEDFETSAA